MADLVFTVTISDAQDNRAIKAISDETGWSNEIVDANGDLVPNPDNRRKHIKKYIRKHLKRLAKRGEVKVAAKRQRDLSETEIEDLNIDAD